MAEADRSDWSYRKSEVHKGNTLDRTIDQMGGFRVPFGIVEAESASRGTQMVQQHLYRKEASRVQRGQSGMTLPRTDCCLPAMLP